MADTFSLLSTTTAATTSAFMNYTGQINSWQNMYRHYELGVASRNTLNDAVGMVVDQGEGKKMSGPEEIVEREPTLKEVWAD